MQGISSTYPTQNVITQQQLSNAVAMTYFSNQASSIPPPSFGSVTSSQKQLINLILQQLRQKFSFQKQNLVVQLSQSATFGQFYLSNSVNQNSIYAKTIHKIDQVAQENKQLKLTIEKQNAKIQVIQKNYEEVKQKLQKYEEKIRSLEDKLKEAQLKSEQLYFQAHFIQKMCQNLNGLTRRLQKLQRFPNASVNNISRQSFNQSPNKSQLDIQNVSFPQCIKNKYTLPSIGSEHRQNKKTPTTPVRLENKQASQDALIKNRSMRKSSVSYHRKYTSRDQNHVIPKK